MQQAIQDRKGEITEMAEVWNRDVRLLLTGKYDVCTKLYFFVHAYNVFHAHGSSGIEHKICGGIPSTHFLFSDTFSAEFKGGLFLV